ncbi:hypothetical protein AOLI_G00186830 [Acnodon oligacanthus]
MSSSTAHGFPLLIDEDQVQNVTTAVKEMLSLFTAVTVEDGEHALKKLHCSIIDVVYAELFQRVRSENQLIEAVETQSELLAGSLAVSIVRAIKNASPKDLQTASCLPGNLAGPSGSGAVNLTKEASSNDPKELIERILREFSASSSAGKLEEVLDGTFVELLQRFGEEGSLHKALDARDSTFDEALMTALRKHLGADVSTAVPETMGVKNIHSKERKGIFFRLKMPKLSIFKNVRKFLK